MNKRLVINILIVTMFVLACGESNISNKRVNNKITKNHIRVSGTKTYLLLPDNFRKSFNMNGYELNDSVGFQVSEIPEGNFYYSTKSLNEKYFRQNGIKVHEISSFKLNGFDSYLVLLQKDSKMNTYSLIFGDSTFVVTVLAFYPTSYRKMGKILRKTLLSSIYEEDFKLNPFETARFRLNDSLNKFKFRQLTFSSYWYTTDSFDIKDNTPFVTITQLPNVYQNGLDTFKFDMQRIYNMRDKGLSWINIKEWKRIEINGYKGYEFIATAEHPETEKECMLYQVIFRDFYNEFYIAAMFHNDFDTNLGETRKLISTFNKP